MLLDETNLKTIETMVSNETFKRLYAFNPLWPDLFFPEIFET